MHSKDRHWRAFALVFGGMLAFCLALLFALFALSDYSLQEVVSEIDWSSSETYLTILMFVALGVAFVRFFIHYVVLARRREACRMKALAGISDAMPAASSQPERPLWATVDVLDLDLDHEPLTLRWANGSTITVSRDGLLWRRPRKRDVLLAWSEARLLEIWESQSPAPRKKDDIVEYGYCLYASRNKYVQWTDAPESQIPGERLSWEQKVQLQEELLALVAGRTNLPLRVVPKRQSAQDQPGQMTVRQKISLAGLGLALFIAAFPLGAGILALVAPLTHSFALNLYAAIVYGGAGLLILGVIMKGLIDIYRPLTPDPTTPFMVLPFVPAAAMPDAGISIRFGERPRDRFIAFLLLVVGLVSNVYLVIRAIQDFSITDLNHGTFTDAHKLGLGLFMVCAFIGIASLCIVVFSRPTVLMVDEEGLHQGKGKKRESIPWRDVAVLTARVSRSNTLKSFDVVESPPHSKIISWRADAHWVRRPDGASPADDAGTQFAAIVAQRAGVQPTTRWE